jgi:DNA-3-methyladenine glycosylase II
MFGMDFSSSYDERLAAHWRGCYWQGRTFARSSWDETAMGLSTEALREGLDTIAAQEPAIARALALAGYPEPRIREPGYATLMRTIVGQQVSVAAAASMWRKLEAFLGPALAPGTLLAAEFDELRACGLSRQKQGYLRSLCELAEAGAIDFAALPADDEEAIGTLTRIKGIGRWSAEIYLLFAEGRGDIWPAGDLAVQAGLQKLMGLEERPSEKRTRELAEAWRPHRGAAAIFTWHCYNNPAL